MVLTCYYKVQLFSFIGSFDVSVKMVLAVRGGVPFKWAWTKPGSSFCHCEV